MKPIIIAASFITLAACSQAPDINSSPPAEPDTQAANDMALPAASHAHADFAGEWIGPEGLFANVVLAAPGEYILTIAGDLDAPAQGIQYQGRDAAGGIVFVRGNQTLLLKRVTGDKTGLKYLDGKTDCLMVQDGEGFCRRAQSEVEAGS